MRDFSFDDTFDTLKSTHHMYFICFTLMHLRSLSLSHSFSVCIGHLIASKWRSENNLDILFTFYFENGIFDSRGPRNATFFIGHFHFPPNTIEINNNNMVEHPF